MRRLILVLSLMAMLMSIGLVATAQNQTVHTVQAGENLYRISLRYGVSMQNIASANSLSNLNLIFVGQQLVIHGGDRWRYNSSTPRLW